MNTLIRIVGRFLLWSFLATFGIVFPGVAGPFEDFLSQTVSAANEGDVRAQTMLGSMYEGGIGVKPDPAKALEWYRAAAARDDSNGQILLARAYADGRGVPRDDQEALKWFRKAAESELRGFSSRPIMFAGGAQGALKAAEGGNYLAEAMVGQMYLTGHGLEQSDAAAVQWLKKVADRGIANEAPLALMYHDGRGGLSKDLGEAMRLYRQAADRAAKGLQDALTYVCLSIGRLPDCKEGP